LRIQFGYLASGNTIYEVIEEEVLPINTKLKLGRAIRLGTKSPLQKGNLLGWRI
jgi:hypothetical protein